MEVCFGVQLLSWGLHLVYVILENKFGLVWYLLRVLIKLRVGTLLGYRFWGSPGLVHPRGRRRGRRSHRRLHLGGVRLSLPGLKGGLKLKWGSRELWGLWGFPILICSRGRRWDRRSLRRLPLDEFLLALGGLQG